MFRWSADCFTKVSQAQNLLTKIAFSQLILILGDLRTTGRVHGGSVTVYQKILNVYTRVHVYTLQPYIHDCKPFMCCIYIRSLVKPSTILYSCKIYVIYCTYNLWNVYMWPINGRYSMHMSKTVEIKVYDVYLQHFVKCKSTYEWSGNKFDVILTDPGLETLLNVTDPVWIWGTFDKMYKDLQWFLSYINDILFIYI